MAHVVFDGGADFSPALKYKYETFKDRSMLHATKTHHEQRQHVLHHSRLGDALGAERIRRQRFHSCQRDELQRRRSTDVLSLQRKFSSHVS